MRSFFKEVGKLILLECIVFAIALALLFLRLPWDKGACNSWDWFCVPPTMLWPMCIVSIYSAIKFLFLVRSLLLGRK